MAKIRRAAIVQSRTSAQGRQMSLWWLSFKGGRIVIVRAETLVHARLLASTAVEGVRAYLFDAGFQVDPEFEQMIPDGVIGRTLSRDEAIDLQRRLRGDAKYYKRTAAPIAKPRRL
jgi:hypothetical protein